MTKKFEQRVARDLWGDARTAFNGPTRRKRERAKHIVIADPNDRQKKLTVPAHEYPAGLVFYKMGKAGLLQGMPENVDLSGLWQMVVIDDDERRRKFLEKHPGKLVLKFRHVPDAFAKLLAKIGYCHMLTMLDLDDFSAICLPYITGEKTNASYVVGGTLDEQRPEPENGYSLSTAVLGNPARLILVALVRLYANTHAPAYHVVVGDVAGTDSVARVIKKLGDVTTVSPTLSSPPQHWEPASLPIPYWKSS
ncbi:MAG: hypothetical protein Q8L22_09720, partial [Reyranella sp.]|nr:hypothetical protein [Reyranella sp.]